ncbi:MAG TPA: nucleotidyltransferase family protein [Vicinamibacteria bacterium]|nr:nucleotidyltransferase family protein [Vicinamibacteria bacterium]
MAAEARERLRRWLVSGELPRPAGATDADELARAARDLGLAGCLDERLTATPNAAWWPQAARASLRDAHRAALLHGTRLLSLALRVQHLLGAQGLRGLPLKGVALLAGGYVGPGERPMGDADLLLLDAWDPAVRALTDAGFTRGEAADHAVGLHDPVTGELLELHHSVTSCPGLFPLDRDRLWQRSHLTNSGLRVPAAEDLLVLGALHASFQHGLVLPLVHYLDFPALLARSSFDASLALEIAGRAQATLALRVALDAAAVVVGSTTPEALRAQLPAAHPALARWLAARLQDPFSLLCPSSPALGRVRWELARGQRGALIRATLAPPRPAGAAASLVQRGGIVGRAFGLAWRWGLNSARTWGAARVAEKGTRV